MNWFGLATVIVGFAMYVAGRFIGHRLRTGTSGLVFTAVAFLLAIPALAYDLYYLKILGNPLWLYQVRTIPGSELLAALAGLLAGWTQARFVPRLHLSSAGKKLLTPAVLGFALALPYLKPLLRPLDSAALREQWKEGACLQSTMSTCGPASAATIVRSFAGNLSERELAREAYTSRSGTESWYLARALRRHGWHTEFVRDDPSRVALPAIAGVRLKQFGNAGHFIALLRRAGEDLIIIADPMEGLSTNTVTELAAQYRFMGLFLVVRQEEQSP